MNTKLITITTAAALALSACMGGPQVTQGVTKAGEHSDGLFGMHKADDIKTTTPEAFKGKNEVIIGGFTVAFLTDKTDTAKAGGGLLGNGMGGKSTAKSKLLGIDDATMQKIADAAYSDFVADLKAKGYTVADRSAMLASDDFKSVTVQPSPTSDSTGGLLTDGNTTKYFSPTSFKGMLAFPGTPGSTSFGFSNPSVAAAEYAKKSNKPVLYVTYLINYSNAQGSGGWASTSSSVSVGQGLTVVPGVSQVGIIGGEGGTFSTNIGSISLGQPITSDKEFATVTDSTSDTAKGMEVATNVIGALGGVGTNSSRHFDFAANPAKYQAAATDALKSANKAFTDKMQALK